MTGIWYLVTSFIYVCHIVGSIFGPVRFLLPVCRLFMHIFHHIFLSNYWWQRSDIWSQALYRYPISLEAFFDPSDSYFLFAEEQGYHKWALAHSSSCFLFLGVFRHEECDSNKGDFKMAVIFKMAAKFSNCSEINEHLYLGVFQHEESDLFLETFVTHPVTVFIC